MNDCGILKRQRQYFINFSSFLSTHLFLIFLALDSISDYYYENEAIIAWWNDWKARDQRAHIEKTYNNGRFSREKRTLGLLFRFYPYFIQLQ